MLNETGLYRFDLSDKYNQTGANGIKFFIFIIQAPAKSCSISRLQTFMPCLIFASEALPAIVTHLTTPHPQIYAKVNFLEHQLQSKTF
jgi:hypothetical protein